MPHKKSHPPPPRFEQARDPEFHAMPRVGERVEGVARDTIYRWSKLEPRLLVRPMRKKTLVATRVLRELIAQGGPRGAAPSVQE